MSSYTDVNTPVIEQMTLPSGNNYYIADREIRDVVQNLIEVVGGGVSFNVVWTSADYISLTAPTAAKLATIPSGVKVYYAGGTSYSTGTLTATNSTKGTFYLIYSETQSGQKDYYDEYVTIETGTTIKTYSWEKIGDTIIDLSNVVQSVTVGSDTYTPDTNGDVDISTAVEGEITDALESIETKYLYLNMDNGDNQIISESSSGTTGISYDRLQELLGAGIPRILFKDGNYYYQLAYIGNPAAGTYRVCLALVWKAPAGSVMSHNEIKTITYTATSSSAALTGTANSSWVVSEVSLNQDTDSVLGANTTFTNGTSSVSFGSHTTDKVLGEGTQFALSSGTVTFGTPTTDTFVKSVSAETNKNLVTTSVTGVQSSTTTASKASAASASSVTRASQTTADGTGTASSTNTDWLKGVSVTNGVLTIGAATMDTQTTYSVDSLSTVNFSDVTVPIKNASATTVATGATDTTGTGSAVVTGVTIGDSGSAITAMPTASVGTTVTADASDKVNAITALGTATAAAQTITVGTDDLVTALTDQTSLSVYY